MLAYMGRRWKQGKYHTGTSRRGLREKWRRRSRGSGKIRWWLMVLRKYMQGEKLRKAKNKLRSLRGIMGISPMIRG